MAAIDLYSGMGGWTLGFKMAGIEVIASYEWWKDANDTHNKNFRSSHSETDIRQLSLNALPSKKKVKFVIGSPPCTQFSLANRGGKGDIADGMVDIIKFLDVVRHIRPKYWAMENVPRVAKILEKELQTGGLLEDYRDLFGNIKVYNSSDFGVPQDRKRMIAGNFPFELLDAYAKRTKKMTLKQVIDALAEPPYIDPIYGIKVPKDRLTDHVREPNLSWEEARINQDAKTHHPVYNRMSFPDRQDRPSRTVTALCTRVSRESIVIRDPQGNIRRLTVRERASLQSFPINYQLFGKTYANKIKMVGNAVPPLLTFYIAQSMLRTPVDELLLPKDVPVERLKLSETLASSHEPDNEGANYPWNRSFWLAIKELRFGSGVRFELRNHHDKEKKMTTWRIGFFYGTSKDIKKKELDQTLLAKAFHVTGVDQNETFMEWFNDLREFVASVDEKGLQENWTHANRKKMSPIVLIDRLTDDHISKLRGFFKKEGASFKASIDAFIRDEFQIEEEKKDQHAKHKPKRNKLAEKGVDIFIGILVGAYFNLKMNGETLKMRRVKVRA